MTDIGPHTLSRIIWRDVVSCSKKREEMDKINLDMPILKIETKDGNVYAMLIVHFLNMMNSAEAQIEEFRDHNGLVLEDYAQLWAYFKRLLQTELENERVN